VEVILAGDMGNTWGEGEHTGHATMQPVNPAETAELTICQVQGETQHQHAAVYALRH